MIRLGSKYWATLPMTNNMFVFHRPQVFLLNYMTLQFSWTFLLLKWNIGFSFLHEYLSTCVIMLLYCLRFFIWILFLKSVSRLFLLAASWCCSGMWRVLWQRLTFQRVSSACPYEQDMLPGISHCFSASGEGTVCVCVFKGWSVSTECVSIWTSLWKS